MVLLEMKSVKRVYITYKFWKNSITNKNKQIEYNEIFIDTAIQKYKFSFVFRNNEELYKLEDSYDQLFTDRQKFRFLNLVHLKLDDIV
jgi:hypothetical protein